MVRETVFAARAAVDADRAVLFFGQDAGLIDSIEPAGAIVTGMVREAYEIITGRLMRIAAP